jgi:hypothetical protein
VSTGQRFESRPVTTYRDDAGREWLPLDAAPIYQLMPDGWTDHVWELDKGSRGGTLPWDNTRDCDCGCARVVAWEWISDGPGWRDDPRDWDPYEWKGCVLVVEDGEVRVYAEDCAPEEADDPPA